jgi:hypothetical protein
MELSSAADHRPVVEVAVQKKAAVVAGISGDCSNDLLGSIFL